MFVVESNIVFAEQITYLLFMYLILSKKNICIFFFTFCFHFYLLHLCNTICFVMHKLMGKK